MDWRPFWILKMWGCINFPHFMSYLHWKCFKWSEIDIKAKERVKVTIWIICREVRSKMADWWPFEFFKNGVDVKQILPILRVWEQVIIFWFILKVDMLSFMWMFLDFWYLDFQRYQPFSVGQNLKIKISPCLCSYSTNVYQIIIKVCTDVEYDPLWLISKLYIM